MSLGQAVLGTPIKRKAFLSNEVKSMWENLSQLSIPTVCLLLWKALRTAINRQAEVSGFLMAITCAVLTSYIAPRSTPAGQYHHWQKSKQPQFCINFLDKFWIIMIIISFRQIDRQKRDVLVVPPYTAIILFLFLCIMIQVQWDCLQSPQKFTAELI